MRKQNGFTLVEMMIVVAVIGILAAVSIPKMAEMFAQNYYIDHGAWEANCSPEHKHEFTHNGIVYARGQVVSRDKDGHIILNQQNDSDQSSQPSVNPQVSTQTTSNNVNVNVSEGDIKYFYDSKTSLCFAQVNGNTVRIPCENIGIKVSPITAP